MLIVQNALLFVCKICIYKIAYKYLVFFTNGLKCLCILVYIHKCVYNLRKYPGRERLMTVKFIYTLNSPLMTIICKIFISMKYEGTLLYESLPYPCLHDKWWSFRLCIPYAWFNVCFSGLVVRSVYSEQLETSLKLILLDKWLNFIWRTNFAFNFSDCQKSFTL